MIVVIFSVRRVFVICRAHSGPGIGPGSLFDCFVVYFWWNLFDGVLFVSKTQKNVFFFERAFFSTPEDSKTTFGVDFSRRS